MNSTTKSILTLAGMVGCAFGGYSDSLDVAFGTEKTVSDSATYETATVAGVLKVRDGAKLTLKETALGGSATTYAEIDVRGQGSTVGYYKDATKIGSLTIGAGGTLGRVVIAEGGVGEFHDVNIAQDAVADSASGYVDCLDIGGQLKTHCFQNPSGKSARLKFNGGWLQFGQNWGQRIFNGPSGALVTYICECVNGNPIDIRQATAAEADGAYLTSSGEVSVEFAGTGDAYLRTGGKPLYNAHFIFNNDGWGYLTGGGTLTRNLYNYTRLCGDNCKGLVLTDGTTLQVTTTLSGQGIYTPSLDATNGCITVADQTATYLWTMGNGNKDGFFRASLPNRMTFRKIGTGTTTVDAPSSAETLQIEAGTVRIAAPFACTNLVLKAGATLEVASRLSYGTLTNNGGSIELADGGEITYATDSTQSLVGYNKTGGTLVKEGYGTLTVYDPTAFGGDVCVRNGTIDFSSARGRTEKYWRLTFTKMITGSASQNKYVRVAGIPFYPYELRNETISRTITGDYVNNGLTDAGVGKDPSELSAGQASFQCTVTYETGATATQIGVNRYFRGWFNNDYPHLMTPEVDPDTGTTLSLAFRLADAAKPVYGYDLINAYGMNRPTSWTLEASTDGINWTVADERADQVAKNAGWSGFASDDGYTSCAFVLPLTYKAAGVANMPTAVGVQVDQGGTLDFSNVTDGQGVNKLTIDAAKGFGTLANAVLSGAGTIEVVNVAGKITDYSFPMTLTDVSGTENLEKWSLIVDGVPMPRRTPVFKASADGGTLSFLGPGLIIMVK